MATKNVPNYRDHYAIALRQIVLRVGYNAVTDTLRVDQLRAATEAFRAFDRILRPERVFSDLIAVARANQSFWRLVDDDDPPARIPVQKLSTISVDNYAAAA